MPYPIPEKYHQPDYLLHLSLQRAYFTHAELSVVEKQIMSKLSPDGICFAMSRLSYADVQEMLPTAGIPKVLVRFVILPMFKRYMR